MDLEIGRAGAVGDRGGSEIDVRIDFAGVSDVDLWDFSEKDVGTALAGAVLDGDLVIGHYDRRFDSWRGRE